MNNESILDYYTKNPFSDDLINVKLVKPYLSSKEKLLKLKIDAVSIADVQKDGTISTNKEYYAQIEATKNDISTLEQKISEIDNIFSNLKVQCTPSIQELQTIISELGRQIRIARSKLQFARSIALRKDINLELSEVDKNEEVVPYLRKYEDLQRKNNLLIELLTIDKQQIDEILIT